MVGGRTTRHASPHPRQPQTHTRKTPPFPYSPSQLLRPYPSLQRPLSWLIHSYNLYFSYSSIPHSLPHVYPHPLLPNAISFPHLSLFFFPIPFPAVTTLPAALFPFLPSVYSPRLRFMWCPARVTPPPRCLGETLTFRDENKLRVFRINLAQKN